MPDLFTLFDGTFGAGGSSAVSRQDGSSFSPVSTENDAVATLASGSDQVELLIDYSDFANFVTFNSAESYVTITADQILNEYPYGGSVNDLQIFLNSLDGYQSYFLALWPSWTGHLRFNPASGSAYVSFTDFGVQDGVARTSFVSPGTGSLSVQGWVDIPAMTGSNDVQVVLQKSGSNGSCTVFASGSSIYYQVFSGSVSATVSGALPAMPSFFAAVLDRSATTGTLTMYVGTTGTFPAQTDQASIVTGARLDLLSGSFYMGSGSISGKVVRPFTGSLDSVSVWASPRYLADLTGSYNRTVYAQSNLIAAWRFNDAGQSTPSSFSAIVHDGSGHRLDGRIQSFFSGIRGSGSLSNDVFEPILSLDDPNVLQYLVAAQTTGALYDRNNPSLIFNIFPDAFSPGSDPTSTQVFQSFALILARHFDRIKTYVGQIPNLRRVSYDDFDQTPDDLLDEVARFMGWDLQGSFATTDALRYFVGRKVQQGTAANSSPTTKMAQIKAEFWRRVLLNLLYVYKTKGTRESVESFLRSYGIDNGFVRLKEYARRTEQRLPTSRITSEKSVYTLKFVSGSSVKFTAR